MERSSDSLVTWTEVIYALHTFSLLTGIIGTATVVGAFLTGWPSIIAVILNYVKRSEARGIWIESHFRWQIRTFWFGLLWISLCVVFIIMTFGQGRRTHEHIETSDGADFRDGTLRRDVSIKGREAAGILGDQGISSLEPRKPTKIPIRCP